MRVQIAARRCDVPESIRSRADEQAARLTRYEPRLSGVEIVFEIEKHVKRVEGIMTIDGTNPLVARGEGSEFRAALDQMLDRAARMLRRQREQARDHQASKLSESPVPEA
jgi:ribosomal subunit interface protein